jgi:hypothetical protein
MKDLAGLILPDIASSAKIWHTFRAQIGKDHTKSDLFDSQYLNDLHKKVGEIQAEGDPSVDFSKTLFMVNKDPITLTQLQAVLKACPNGSAAGLDQIHYEAYKFGGPALLQALTDILQISWISELHPTQWDRALVAPLFKGGPDPNDVSKYRAITLLCTSCKLYEALLLGKIHQVLRANSSLSDTQSGFVADVSSHEPVTGLLTTLHHRAHKGQKSYVIESYYYDLRLRQDIVEAGL